ncbi:MAG: LmbE family protein [Flavobacteriaceae bacterium CG_4_8_14_3_um_filter_34_10]|nr:MAG: LmbE family protein [Flavobacteriaceae bacterium CG_4_8_14_3_um_filter_34_10]
MQKSFFLLLFLVFLAPTHAQQPKKPTSSEIYQAIQKLNFLGSVLYIAAHPDDENTRLISHLSNDVKARTAYLSITRGDGGQNLIGTELSELLGVIRTNELLEARKTDGGEQFFTRANDFGYSKNPEETFTIWGKEDVLSDVVLAIRRFQPDIIINRFNHRTPGTTHGHHTASAILGMEAFALANNKTAYPNQLQTYTIWQAQRLFFNTSWWFYGSQENFDKADKSNLVSLKTGTYYPSLGLSDGEIAALSRSKHQSQGFGNTGIRGEDKEYLELLKGAMPKIPSNLFEGINTTWTRIEGGNAIGKILIPVEDNFDFKNPAASIPELLKAYRLLKNRTDYWGIQKTKEIKNIIAACSGLFMEAVAEMQYTCPASSIKIKVEAINRSNIPMELVAISYDKKPLLFEKVPLNNNERKNLEYNIIIPKTAQYTSPYWLKEKGRLGLYNVKKREEIGLPSINPNEPITFILNIAGEEIAFQKDIVYKFNSPVLGEVYHPFQVLPEIYGSFKEKVLIFDNASSRQIPVVIKSGRDNISGTITLQCPEGWQVSAPQTFLLDKKDQEKEVLFTVTPPKSQEEGQLHILMQVGDSFYNKERITIDYPHIPFQHVLIPAEAKIARIDLHKNGENIGYIAGAGDEIPSALEQIGYQVTQIQAETMTVENLKQFDAIVVGIRAYNVVEALKFKQEILFKYVENGGNLLMQYNVSRGLVTDNLTPYPLKLSNDRVTDEFAEVTFIHPNHPVLQTPNKITEKDFENWVQERGLYFPNEWGKEFTPILQMNDQGETPTQGALLIAKHGKGHFIYTGLSFFRELPAGVSGAYRLFANLLSLSE